MRRGSRLGGFHVVFAKLLYHGKLLCSDFYYEHKICISLPQEHVWGLFPLLCDVAITVARNPPRSAAL